MTTGTIFIANRSSHTTEIDIEGLIGIAEEGQFENPEQRVATYDKFKWQVEALREIETPEIVINIRSVGGNVNDALLIHDTLCGFGKRITTRCYGYVASAATLIAQAASPGRREMSSNGLYLIHQSVADGEGNTGRLAQAAEMLAQTDRRIAELYAARSGKPVATFIELMGANNGNGRWLSPREAKAAGLIDRIIGSGGDIPGQHRRIIHAFNLPEPPEADTASHPAVLMRRFGKLLRRMGGRGEGRAAARKDPECKMLPTAENTTVTEATGGSPRAAHDPVPVAITGNARKSGSTPKAIPPADPPARTAARPTETLPKEDPSPGERRLPSNTLSYLEDLRNLTCS